MELHTDDLAIDGRTRREQEVENFKKIIEEDARLHSRINQEIEDRKAADAAEKAARIAADDAEEEARTNEDNDLQGQIDGLRTRLTTAEGTIKDLQARTSSLEEQVKKLNEIIFGTQYINDTDDIPVDDSMTPNPNAEELNDTDVYSDDDAEVNTSDDHVVLDHEIN